MAFIRKIWSETEVIHRELWENKKGGIVWMDGTNGTFCTKSQRTEHQGEIKVGVSDGTAAK